MVKTHYRVNALLSLLLTLGPTVAFAQSQTNARAAWFVDARFGMFIHWGVYSGAEGIWKGEKLRYDNDYAEWIRYRNRIGREEYLTLLDRFDWDEIDPEEWVLLAKRAGMKYVTLTAKHHDGFALWDSHVGNYDIGDFTNPKRDIVRELAAACRKHGLKLGLYYSHWVDWEHPYGWDHTREIYGLSPEKFDQYWQEKVIPQMRELLTQYGEISLIWFDMWVHHSETIVTKEQLLQLKKLIRDLQPNCLINSRLGLSLEEDPDVDFQTLGDNQLGSQKKDYPWQTPATVAHSWGYHALDTEWKSTTTLLHSLINNVSLNGNMMLNIGPRANGEVPHEIEQRLETMGEWMAANGEAIYGAGACDLSTDLHDWGRITYRRKTANENAKLYLHVYNWPLDHQLRLTGMSNPPAKIYLLSDKSKTPLSFVHKEVVTRIDLPSVAPDPYVSVVVVEYQENPATVQSLVGESAGNGFNMSPRNAFQANGGAQVEKPMRFGSVPSHVALRTKSNYRWKIYVDRPGARVLDASYSYQGNTPNGKITATVAGTTLMHTIRQTGKTVGEPNQDWVINSFESHRLGEINFPEAGYYEISLEVLPPTDGEILFQWIWLGKN